MRAAKNKQKQKSVGLIGKKKSLAVQHNFLYISLPLLLQRETSKLHVLWRKCRMCSQKNFVACVPVRFFSLPLIFTLLFAHSSYFHSDGISCCSYKKIRLLCFSSLFWLSVGLQFSLSSPSLSPTFLRSLSFSFSTFQICGHDN